MDTQLKALLPKGYTPNENEPYMNPTMLAYFEQKLLQWRGKLSQQSSYIKNSIEEQSERMPDRGDEALLEETRGPEYFLVKHDSDLIIEIDKAISRIHNGIYGYCEYTGDQIGAARLNAWPIARLTIEQEEKLERGKDKKDLMKFSY